MDNKTADKCPLCASHNHCALAAGKTAMDCWCITAEISAAVLAALPEAERGKRCLCQECATQKRKAV